MSAAAPKLFGSAAGDEKVETSSVSASGSGVYPPMSFASPKPFGVSAKTSSSSKSSGGYPPLSAAAPKPFGSATADKISSAAKPSTSIGVYPPMSAAAPMPFGQTSATKATSSESSTATSKSPFNSFSGAGKSNVNVGFGAISGGASSGFESISSSSFNQSPFKTGPISKSASNEKGSTAFGFGALAATISSANSSSKFNSNLSKNKTFGDVSNSVVEPSQNNSTQSSPTVNLNLSSKGGYPPISTVAPKPFGSVEFYSGQAKPKASISYPPISSVAPKSFNDAKKNISKDESKSKSSIQPKIVHEKNNSSSKGRYPPMSMTTPKKFSGNKSNNEPRKAQSVFHASTHYEAKVWEGINKFHDAMISLRMKRERISSESSSSENLNGEIPEKFISQLEDLIDSTQTSKVEGMHLGQEIDQQKQHLVYFMSVKDDLDRQTKESQLLIENNDKTAIDLRHLPLDPESEFRRRCMRAKTIKTQKNLIRLQDRFVLSNRIFGTNRVSNNYDRSGQQVKNDLSSRANNALFNALKNGFDQTKKYEAFMTTMKKQIEDLSQKMSTTEISTQIGSKSQTASMQGGVRSSRSKGGRRKLIPVAGPFVPNDGNVKKDNPCQSLESSNPGRSELFFQKIKASEKDAPVKIFERIKLAQEKKLPGKSKKMLNWRQNTTSKLMSMSESASKASSKKSSSVQPVFTSPLSTTGSKSSWISEDVDINNIGKISFSVPESRKEIDMSVGSKKVFGKINLSFLYC